MVTMRCPEDMNFITRGMKSNAAASIVRLKSFKICRDRLNMSVACTFTDVPYKHALALASVEPIYARFSSQKMSFQILPGSVSGNM